MTERAEVSDEMLANELDWVERRWGANFAACVAWSYGEGMSLGAAEYWHGLGWGIIKTDGPQDLEEAAMLEDRHADRMEYQAQIALGHGF